MNTLPLLIGKHVHISEREIAHLWPDGQRDDARWEDCGWTSAVEFARAMGIDAPATLVEAEALRSIVMGPRGGARASQLALGISRKYKINLIVLRSFFTLWAALFPGTVASIGGDMGVFSKGHRLRRHSPSFDGAHNVTIFRVDATDRVWWCDPLAPKTGYSGEWVTKDELRQFVTGLIGGGHIVGRISPKMAGLPPEPPKPPAPKPAPIVGKFYMVKVGDSLWKIAIRNLTTLGRIRALNPGLKDLIRPGQVIRVK